VGDLLDMTNRCVHLYRSPMTDCAECLHTALAASQAECEELRRDVVSAVKLGMLIVDGPLTWVLDDENDDDEYRIGTVDCDGTDEGIRAAVRQARGKGE
jgi:hypothetical protein